MWLVLANQRALFQCCIVMLCQNCVWLCKPDRWRPVPCADEKNWKPWSSWSRTQTISPPKNRGLGSMSFEPTTPNPLLNPAQKETTLQVWPYCYLDYFLNIWPSTTLNIWWDRGGGQVVSMLAFCSFDLSSNPAEVDNFSVKLYLKRMKQTKEAGVAQFFLKKPLKICPIS